MNTTSQIPWLTVLALLPTLLLVLFGQRFIVRGLTAGSGR